MIEVASVWAVLTAFCAALATFAVWSRGNTRLRFASVIGFLITSPVIAIGLSFTLGWPVPMFSGINAPPGDWPVLGSKMVVGEGIYVLLDTGDVPRHYVMPWSKATSDKLQELLDSENGGVRMKMPPFEFSWEQRKPPEFYALPQPKVLPDKPRQEEPPTRFDSI